MNLRNEMPKHDEERGEYEKWLTVDPRPQVGRWIKSDMGRFALLLLAVSAAWVGAIMFGLSHLYR